MLLQSNTCTPFLILSLPFPPDRSVSHSSLNFSSSSCIFLRSNSNFLSSCIAPISPTSLPILIFPPQLAALFADLSLSSLSHKADSIHCKKQFSLFPTFLNFLRSPQLINGSSIYTANCFYEYKLHVKYLYQMRYIIIFLVSTRMFFLNKLLLLLNRNVFNFSLSFVFYCFF